MAWPEAGDTAPDFDLPTDDGGNASLSGLTGKKLVLYFYPKDDTQGCTLEALDFSAKAADFEATGTVVVGVSPDSLERHGKFRKKHNLTIRLAADPERTVIEAYGAWQEKKLYGRQYMGVVRSTFLIDSRGRIARVWRNVKVKGHVDEVLAAARELPA